MQEITQIAYQKAIETIEKCSTPYGLYASGGKKGYFGVWARDSMITLIGASTDENPLFKDQFKKSLRTLGKYQSKLGEIPNAVLHLERKKPQVDYKSIDSNLWFLIGHYVYRARYKDNSLFQSQKSKIKKALTWIKYRDFGSNTTLEQLPTTDWQDAFPNKYGVTINTQALYHKILLLTKSKKIAKKLRKQINKDKENKLWNKEYYWAYRWKNHNKYKEIGSWFDSLGNILAIIYELPKKRDAKKILNYVERKNINKPFPLKCIDPPIKQKSKDWEDYYYDAKATPGHYLNGGIWPFIGGFYILALIKLKRFNQAKRELKNLAESNTKKNYFPEWIDPKTKKTYGQYQAWSAGTYIWAYNSLKKKKFIK